MDLTMKWLSLLHDPDEIIELRSIDPKPVVSGYFRADSSAIPAQLARYPNRTFYQTMNRIDPGCYARAQRERLIERPAVTTTDADIRGLQWILVDADPVRPSGVSASDAEKEAARRVAGTVMKKLMSMGFSEPVVGDSGNGYHLLFRIHATIDDKQIIADFLSVLDMWFSTEEVKIDTAVFNPARITKLYGTVARKGASAPDRPHRPSAVLRFPDPVRETSMTLVRNVAEQVKRPAKPAAEPDHPAAGLFSLDRFLEDHGVGVFKKVTVSAGVKYMLDRCPFDESHGRGDAAVFAFRDGSYGFHCFHNSCSGYHWHDFRQKVDPRAYDNSPYTVCPPAGLPVTAAERQEPPGPRMLDFAAIPDVDRGKIVVIRSRFAALDARIGGFNKGELSVWSGGNASGKSTLVSQIGLAAVTEGFKVAMFSGEMTASRLREWLLLQAAGPDHVERDKLSPGHWCLRPGVEKKLDAYLTGRLAVYDNRFGTDWEAVMNTVTDWVRKNDASVAIIDNLMALDIPTGSLDKYDMQSKIVKRFAALAKELNIHIHFICHPRKTDAFLRKSDISGSADLTNAADNVFMVHRINADFLSRARTVYPGLEIPTQAGNVIEIMKNRDLGVVDEMIMLYFDKRCKTMSDVRGLPPQHAWTENLDPAVPEGMTRITELPDDFPEEWRS